MKILGIAVIFFLLGVSSVKIYDNVVLTDEEKNVIDLIYFKKKLLDYKQSCGHFPRQEYGFQALVNPQIENCNSEPFLQGIPTDAWVKEFHYIIENDVFFLFSENSEGIATSKK